MTRFAARMNKVVDSIPAETMEAMLAYDWPGNIRELQNFMERGVILSTGSVFQPPFTPLQRRPQHVLPQAGKLSKTPCGSIFCKLWIKPSGCSVGGRERQRTWESLGPP